MRDWEIGRGRCLFIPAVLLLTFLLLSACRPAASASLPTITPAPIASATSQATPTQTFPPPAVTPLPTTTPAVTPSPPHPATRSLPPPTLADLWSGRAHFILDQQYTGLPMGESDTLVMDNGEFWSYLHSSSLHPAGAVDQCGDPVPFPGCTVIYRSTDGGYRFRHDDPPVCQFACHQCPCDAETDHVNQQQYPDVYRDGDTFYLVYEYLGRVMLRRSIDGLNWSRPERVAETGIWKTWLLPCPAAERIGEHPYVPYDYECLAGGPPAVYVEDGELYVFLAVGQSPGGLGCYRGPAGAEAGTFTRCTHNPLFSGSTEYGPLETTGREANPYFDFRTISSAEILPVGDGNGRRFYALYEGIRGPGPGDLGDSQFGLGLARSRTPALDGPWETYPGNPLLVDLPGNVGLGHADLVVYQGQTILYTSLDGVFRSRLVLVWRE